MELEALNLWELLLIYPVHVPEATYCFTHVTGDVPQT